MARYDFSLPRVSRRFVPVWRRMFLVWRKLAVASVLGNIADPMIALVAFGYGLGSLLPEVEGVRYVVFLAAGTICMSTMYAATFEATYSSFSRMQIQRTWDGIMNAPIELEDVLLGELFWAATKSFMSGVAIMIVVTALGLVPSWTALWLLPLVVLLGLVFAAMGLVINSFAKGYDFFTFYFTLVITPMAFMSGVFFPMSQLPAWLQTAAQALPLTHAVALARPLLLGNWPPDVWLHVAALMAYVVLGYYAAVVLTRKRMA
jgi:lipooligosaccharide transport system permease protein